MKILRILGILIIISTKVLAFDPEGPPPPKTIERTIELATKLNLNIIDVGDESTLRQVFRFLELKQSMPKEYGFNINGDKLSKELLESSIKFKAKNITFMKAMAKIADLIGCKLVIEPGVVYFQPIIKTKN